MQELLSTLIEKL